MGTNSGKLSATEQQVWNIALSLTEIGFGLRLVILSYKAVDYLFATQDKVGIKGESLYPNQEKLKLKSLSRQSDWGSLYVDGGQYDIHHELFIVNGFSSQEELVRATLRNIRNEVTVVRLAGEGALEIQETAHFEPLLGFGDRSGSSVRKFFRERRIVSGNFELGFVNHYLMNAVLNPLAIEEFLQTGIVPKDYFTVPDYAPYERNVYCPNKLYYVAEEEEFRFEIGLERDPEYTDAERVMLIRRVLDFIFSDVGDYFRDEQEEAGIREVLKCSDKDLEKIWEAFYLSLASDQDAWFHEEFSDLVQNWVVPELVEVSISTVEIDPSRGTKLWESMKVTQYSESYKEWQRTNFEKIQPRAYLERLQSQYGNSVDPVSDDNYSLYLALQLEDLGFLGKTYIPLNRHGIQNLGQIIALTEDELLKIAGLGPRGILEISRRVKEMGLGFLIETPAWPFVDA
jgi:hypothetical protein